MRRRCAAPNRIRGETYEKNLRKVRRSMKIMIINHYAGSPYHGMEFRPYLMAREWQKLGHETVIVAADYTHLRRKNPEIAADFTEQVIDGIRYVFLRTPVYHGNNVGRGKNIAAFCLKLLHNAGRVAHTYRPEAVIASSTYPVDIYPAAKIARKAGARLYFEIHDLWPLTPMEMGNLPWWNPLILLLQAGENYAFRHSQKIISILPDADRYIRSRGYDVSKFVYVPNGVVRGEAKAAREDLPQIRKLDALRAEGCFIVGYTGNHSSANGLEYFIEAARLMREQGEPRVIFTLVGGGNVKEELMERAKGLDNVLFLDPVPKDGMGALLRRVDVAYMGLAKSRLFEYGVSPNKLFDYMLAERPVLYAVESSNNPVRDAGCGLSTAVGKPEEIVKAVRAFMAMDAEALAEMGRRGRAYVEKNHDYPTLAAHFAQSLQ